MNTIRTKEMVTLVLVKLDRCAAHDAPTAAASMHSVVAHAIGNTSNLSLKFEKSLIRDHLLCPRCCVLSTGWGSTRSGMGRDGAGKETPCLLLGWLLVGMHLCRTTPVESSSTISGMRLTIAQQLNNIIAIRFETWTPHFANFGQCNYLLNNHSRLKVFKFGCWCKIPFHCPCLSLCHVLCCQRQCVSSRLVRQILCR